MTTRRDLFLELETQLDGNGDYDSAWVETASVFNIDVVVTNIGNGQVYVEEAYTADSSDDTYLHILGAASGGKLKGSVNIASRYFRVKIDGGTASNTFRASVRAVSTTVVTGLS